MSFYRIWEKLKNMPLIFLFFFELEGLEAMAPLQKLKRIQKLFENYHKILENAFVNFRRVVSKPTINLISQFI